MYHKLEHVAIFSAAASLGKRSLVMLKSLHFLLAVSITCSICLAFCTDGSLPTALSEQKGTPREQTILENKVLPVTRHTTLGSPSSSRCKDGLYHMQEEYGLFTTIHFDIVLSKDSVSGIASYISGLVLGNSWKAGGTYGSVQGDSIHAYINGIRNTDPYPVQYQLIFDCATGEAEVTSARLVTESLSNTK